MTKKAAPMFTRYAIYFTSSDALAARGAAWLGWDIATGQSVSHPDIAGLQVANLTQTPRRYGFHATIKPPFALSDAMSEADLRNAFQALCGRIPKVRLDGLEVRALGRFLALLPQGSQDGVRELAATVVRDLDDFRAPAEPEELTRRRGNGLSEMQERNLLLWGYPHVMDAFRFHMTLTDRVANAGEIAPMISAFFASALTTPFWIDTLSLVGEQADGMFRLIEKRPLTAQP